MNITTRTTPAGTRLRRLNTRSRTAAATLFAAMLAASVAHSASDTWVGTTDATWATSTNWLSSGVPGTGDTATFNDAGNGNTIIDLGGTGVTLGSLVFDTSLVGAYTIGSGEVGSQTLTFGTLNTGITLNSTVASDQLVNANIALSTTGNYNFTNNSTTNSLTIAGGISASTTGNKTLTVTGSGNTTISGAITNGSGAISTVIKTGTGTLTLSGTSTYTGGTRANAGTTILSGTRLDQAGGGDWLSVNNVGAQNATLKIVSGANWGINDFNVGEVANSRAAVFQTGGSLAVTNGVWIGNGGTSYAYYSLSSGTLTNTGGDFAVGRANGSTGVMDVSGGSITTGSWIVLGRNGGTASGLLNVTGGSVTSNSNNIALNWGGASGAISILNVGGGAGAASVTGVSNGGNYLDVSVANVAGQTGVVNVLNNGTLTVAKVQVGGAASTALFNFNGGTLKATAANAATNFMNDGDMDAVTVYSGGGTIDNNGTNITIGNVLGAATGNGITSIAVTDGGSGYIGAPMVKITGGTGNTATGYAVMVDDGTGAGTYKIDSIVVTSPGTYSVDPTTVTLVGGGATTAATLGAITTATNSSGGMTFSGSGTTTLSAANTYTGSTTINSGSTLKLASTGSIANSSIISVGSGATFDVSAVSGYTVGGTLKGTGTVVGNVTISGTFAPGNSPGTLNVTGNLTLAGITEMEIGASAYDQAIVGGTLTYGGDLNIVSFESFNLAQTGSYNLFDFTGSPSGQFESVSITGIGDLSLVSGGFSGTYGGLTYAFANDSGILSVTASAIPEPSTYAAIVGALALAGVVWQRRRRRAA